MAGRRTEHGYTISSPGEPNCSGELIIRIDNSDRSAVDRYADDTRHKVRHIILLCVLMHIEFDTL